MIRSEARIDFKRRHLDSKRRQFANAVYKELDYLHRLNFYESPPTAELSLEEFETWAIDRLRGIDNILCLEELL
jgi:DNA primase large subunit